MHGKKARKCDALLNAGRLLQKLQFLVKPDYLIRAPSPTKRLMIVDRLFNFGALESIVGFRHGQQSYAIFIYFRSRKQPLTVANLASGVIFQRHEQGRKGRCGAFLRAFLLFANGLNIFPA
jgi:hypothetical protein